MRLSPRQFDRIVRRTIRGLPPDIRGHLINVMVTVLQRPAPALLAEMGYPPDEPLLGVFFGTALTERSLAEAPLLPDEIILFQKPLEEMCRNTQDLRRQIAITVVHEIAHYFGIGEERLAELGYE